MVEYEYKQTLEVMDDLNERKNKLTIEVTEIENIIRDMKENRYAITDDDISTLEAKIALAKEESDDIIIELEVEDFLLHGAGRTRDVEYN